jgi:hypothetical protein
MHSNTLPMARRGARGTSPWILLTGGSVGLFAGFAVDLLRLGLHSARNALQAHRVEHCPGGCS